MAMGITQALKLQAGPIDALAKLPQQQLVQMAQQGRIPADVLPVILNEKAQMAQQVANMQAAQQPMPASVTEQNMMINAQAEAQSQPRPAMMAAAGPMGMPSSTSQPGMAQATEPGLAGLNVPNQMYNLAGGGIVAFDDGGEVPGYAGPGGSLVDLVRAQQESDPSSQYYGTGPTTGLSDFIRQYGSIMSGLPGRGAYESSIANIQKLLGETRGRSATEAQEDRYQRLLEAGLGMMGGTSPYAFTNIAQGALPAAKAYAQDVRERRKQELALSQAESELARKQYEMQSADVTGGLGLFREARAEDRATADRASRERQAELDRENRLTIAKLPDKVMQIADKLRKDNPTMSYLESVTQASQAVTPRDTYNATRNAVSAAAKDANAQFTTQAAFDSKLQEDMRKAAAGDRSAAARVQAVRDRIQQEVFRLYQVEGVDLSQGRMGASRANDPLGIR